MRGHSSIRIILFFLFVVNQLSAQSTLENFEELSSGVGKVFSCDIDYKLYKQGSNTVKERLAGYYAQGETGSYFKAANTEYVWNNNENLVINHDVNIVIIRSEQKKSIPSQVDYSFFEEITDSISLIDENAITVTYLMSFPDSLYIDYSKVEITYNKQHKQPQKIKLYYKNKINFSHNPEKEEWGRPIIEVNYKNFSSKVDEYMYSLSRFYTTNDKKEIKLKSTYSDYELHNLKQQKP